MTQSAQQSPGASVSPSLVDDAERAATCALSGLAGVGPQTLELLRARYGSLASAAARGGRELSSVPGLRSDGVTALAEAPDLEQRGAWLLSESRKLGARVILAGEEGYPALLAQAQAAPPVLYVLGTLSEQRRAAVVGARRSDGYGLERAIAATELLCRAGFEVVSGGAEGVDKVAHEQALKLGARTVAVVGTGLQSLYPATHRGLYERIAARGAVVSEFAIDAGGNRAHFPRRNRTIAGLSEAVVFARGTGESGAISTCRAAERLGRPVFAVPGNVGDPLAEGTNMLLADGSARAFVTGTELLTALGVARVAAPEPKPAAAAVPERWKSLYEALGPAPRHVDELADAAGLGLPEALAGLLELELGGLCAAQPGKYFLRR